MSKKQDRTYVRKPSELEQKYNFGQNFSDIKQLISTAQRAAADAQNAVANINNELEKIALFDSKLNAVEAQSVYTAMMTDTLLEGQEMKEKISNWYTNSLWTADMVNSAVEKGALTSDEAAEILG